MKEYQILTCFVILLLEALPSFYKRTELLFSRCIWLSLTLYTCDATKELVHKIAGMETSTPTISVHVDIFVMSFYFVELTIGNQRPKDKPTPEYPRMLGWTANDASTHHLKFHLFWHCEAVKDCVCLWCIASDVPT